MADRPRMTAAQLANKLLVDEHPDVLRDSAAWMAAELMEAEVAAQIGAELGERTSERLTHRNGYRPRRWDTRVGELELAIPRLRQGSYFPSFLEPRRRAEQALVAVVQEAYVNGVSTARSTGWSSSWACTTWSKDQVSRLCRGLDTQVRVFCERPLEGAYPYLWLDAKVERVREPGGVRHKALPIAYGVHQTGRREVIGIDVGEAETEAFWREFLRGLRARGLAGVRLCVSDAHEGLKQAIAKVLGCPWQRCTLHFLRDMLGHVGKAQQPMIAAAIRGIFQASSLVEARQRLVEVVDKLAAAAPKVARLLEAAEAELLAFYQLPAEHWIHLRTTDESFKARVALLAGSGVVRLSVGRGRPRSQEQGRGAGSPAAQLCPLRAHMSRPSGGGHAPSEQVIIGAWSLAAWVASRRRAGGRRPRPAR
jgi:putative transposase